MRIISRKKGMDVKSSLVTPFLYAQHIAENRIRIAYVPVLRIAYKATQSPALVGHHRFPFRSRCRRPSQSPLRLHESRERGSGTSVY